MTPPAVPRLRAEGERHLRRAARLARPARRGTATCADPGRARASALRHARWCYTAAARVVLVHRARRLAAAAALPAQGWVAPMVGVGS